jgi:hypothetical protein
MFASKGAAAQTTADAAADEPLPITVNKVWYRTGKIHPFGKAYEQSGTLTVSATGLEFSSKKETITILKENIRQVSRGQLGPDLMNNWVIVHHTTPAGEAIAAFKAALFSGKGKEDRIHSALLKLMAGP